MSTFNWDRPFIPQDQMPTFSALDRKTARMYGSVVKAAQISNVDYKMRFGKLKSKQAMQPPPSCGRIFMGYLVVRNLGTAEQYETWMPDHVFEELYEGASEP